MRRSSDFGPLHNTAAMEWVCGLFREVTRRSTSIEKRQFSMSTRCVTKLKYYEYNRRVDVPPQTAAVIAGRKWLPGAMNEGHRFPDYVASPRDNFPAMYTVPGSSEHDVASVADLAKEARGIIEHDLHIHGALLFRGLQLNGDFSRFVRGLRYTTMAYVGGLAVRHQVGEGVMTASDDTSEYSIEPHNEMAYSNTFPTKLFFYCDIPPLPGRGGESVISDGRDVLAKLDPELVEKVRRVGIRYYRYLPSTEPGGYTTWQQSFLTENKADVERFLVEHGREYCWEEDGALVYWYNHPGFVTHPKTGQQAWFNHFHTHHSSYFKDHPMWAHLDIPDEKYPFHCYYGDGSDIEAKDIQHVRDVLWEVSVGFQMQRGDILAVDNIYVSHARLGFTGERRLLVSLTTD